MATEKTFKEQFEEEQMEYAEAKKVADSLEPVNEIEIEESATGHIVRPRSYKIRVKRKFNHDLDLAIQEDAERYGMNSIYNKLVSGEPVPPHAIKDNMVYSENIPEVDDLTDVMIQAQANKEKFGENYEEQIQAIIDGANNNDDELNDDEKVAPSNDSAKEAVASQSHDSSAN